MNIELLDMSRMTILAKSYVQKGQFAPSLASSASVDRRLFKFAPVQDGDAVCESESCEEWLKELARRGATDFKLIIPVELDSFERLDRANGIRCCIICFYRDRATSWNKLWLYDAAKDKWFVQYVEMPVDRMHEKPVFEDVSDNMTILLERIRDLSRRLQLSEFSFRFSAALKALQSDYIASENTSPVSRRLMQAATEAYVFGGNGSWTDTARFAAAGKGMFDEYELLTRDLYRGIALSIMYAVNEW